jgi:mannose-1-phosphate guanylyltransferase
VPTDANGRVTAFLEKTDNPPTDQINAGCYVFRREVIEAIPAGRRVSVERETFPGLLAAGARLQGHVDGSYWLDVGTPEAFVRGCADLVLGIAPTTALPGPTGVALVLPGAVVDASAVLTGGSTIGAGCVVEAGARVDGSVLFDGVRVGANAIVERSVVGAGARIGAGAVLCDTVIGDRAAVGDRCELRSGARVWPGVELAECAVRFSTDA